MRSVRLLLLLWSLASASLAWGDEAITPSPHLPKTSPWNLAKLSAPPKFEWVDREGPVRSLFYAGEPYGGKPTRVFAYYATPGSVAGDASLDKNLPAVVLIHGGGGTAFREWAELWAKRGYAAIAMDTAGFRPIEGKNAHDGNNRTRLDDGGPQQGDDEKFGSVDKEPGEQWTYHAVADAILAHSLIRSFPEVDRERTAVTGISWGGYLTCIVAGVDCRFKAAVPVYGCGHLAENSCWLDRFAKMTPAQRERWTTLWDPSQYLPAVSMPILFVNGTNDFAYPLDSYMQSYALVPGEKQLCVTVNMPHGHQAGWAPQEIGVFVDQHLCGGAKLPALDEILTQDGIATAKLLNDVPVAKADVHFTSDTSEINKRQWQTKSAMIKDGTISATELPAEATAWFLTVRDKRGAVVSSQVEIRK
jgi:dienelactone hydrolase